MYLCLIVFVDNTQQLRQIKNIPTLTYQHSRHLVQDGRHSLKHHYLLKKKGTKKKPQHPLLNNKKGNIKEKNNVPTFRNKKKTRRSDLEGNSRAKRGVGLLYRCTESLREILHLNRVPRVLVLRVKLSECAPQT